MFYYEWNKFVKIVIPSKNIKKLNKKILCEMLFEKKQL